MALAGALRTGRRHWWGNLALTAVNSALWSADAVAAGRDPWEDGRRLEASHPKLAPTLEVVDAGHAEASPFLVAMRKTCCLTYGGDQPPEDGW